ncbi:MAG: GNAT family N-acetyltransferase [Pseudomonadota bacterium]
MSPVLQTDRLTLRQPTGTDAPFYAAFYATATGPGNYGGPRRADEAFRVLCTDIGHWLIKGFGKWIVTRRQTGEALGGCGIVHPDGWPSHELTWWLMPIARGQGIAAEASRAVLTYAYDTLGWPVVETHMRDENTPARRLATRLGGTVTRRETFPDGVTRDVFALPRPAGVSA